MENQYTCDFGGGLKITATIDRALLEAGRGRTDWYTVAIEGQLVAGAIPKYREWMLMIHQDAAELLQGKVLFVFQYSPQHIQTWECAPGVEPRQIDVSKVVPRRPPKPNCPRCQGRGFIGRDFKTKTLLACSCVAL